MKVTENHEKITAFLTWTACTTTTGGGMGVKAWLKGVHPTLASHEGVFSAYGIGREEDLRSLDEEDVEALAARLREQSVPPLQVKLVLKAMRTLASLGHTPDTTPSSGVGAPAQHAPASADRSGEHADGAESVSSTEREEEEEEGEEEEEEEAEISESDDDEGDDDDENGEGEPLPAKRGRADRARSSTTRPLSRKGTSRLRQAGAAAAAGNARCPTKLEHSKSKTSRRAMGAQASAPAAADGRASQTHGLSARGKGDRCIVVCNDLSCTCAPDAVTRCQGSGSCARRLSSFTAGLVSCQHTASEAAKLGGTRSMCASPESSRIL